MSAARLFDSGLDPRPRHPACLRCPAGIGAPTAANRGASGIDGVLSTAVGFADGLGRGATLVVGDLSFLHDINGLNLLRSGEALRWRCAVGAVPPARHSFP